MTRPESENWLWSHSAYDSSAITSTAFHGGRVREPLEVGMTVSRHDVQAWT